jgi:cyclophilin family peptidyl-prolyl cis-trans isomerase
MILRSPNTAGRVRLAVFACLTVLVLAACTGTGGSGTAAPSSETPTTGEASPAGGPTSCPTSQPEPLAAGETRTVTIKTELGDIAIAVDADLSPIAAANFVALAECGYYDDVVFHRAAKLQDGTPFVIQGGDPTGTGTGGPGYTITDEPVTTPYARGTVAMARTSEPNSVGSQFFIVLDDGAADVLASYNTYQIIGSVVEGMETADAILAAADAESPSDPVEMTDVSVSAP